MGRVTGELVVCITHLQVFGNFPVCCWIYTGRMGPVTTWAIVSSAGLVVMTGLYLDKRDDYASQVEACNAEKLLAVAEAERVTRQEADAAAAQRIADLKKQAESADRAREIAEEATRQAEARTPRVREVIREVAANDSCIDTRVPVELVDSLRD